MAVWIDRLNSPMRDLECLSLFIYFLLVCSTITLKTTRRLLEKHLSLAKKSLDAHKEYIAELVDDILANDPDAAPVDPELVTDPSPVPPVKRSRKKKKKQSSDDEDDEDDEDFEPEKKKTKGGTKATGAKKQAKKTDSSARKPQKKRSKKRNDSGPFLYVRPSRSLLSV